MTPAEFVHALNSHRRRQEQKWEHTRQLGAWMMACVAGDKAPTPEQLFPLAADEERARIRDAAKVAGAAAAIAEKSEMLARIAARNERIKAAQQANG